MSRPGAGDTTERSRAGLDGKAFRIEMRPSGQEPVQDRLAFTGGQFDSEVCHKYGFSAAPYVSRSEEDAQYFNADTRNDEGEVDHWVGRVMGSRIEGTLVEFPPGKEPSVIRFSGSLE